MKERRLKAGAYYVIRSVGVTTTQDEQVGMDNIRGITLVTRLFCFLVFKLDLKTKYLVRTSSREADQGFNHLEMEVRGNVSINLTIPHTIRSAFSNSTISKIKH